jgi:hypothetical protein
MYGTWTHKTPTMRSALYHTARILWLTHLYIVVLSKLMYRYPNSGKSPVTGSVHSRTVGRSIALHKQVRTLIKRVTSVLQKAV